MKEDSLFGGTDEFVFTEHDDTLDLDALQAKEDAEAAQAKKELKRANGKRKAKLIGVTAGVVAGLLAASVGVITLDPFGSAQQSTSSSSDTDDKSAAPAGAEKPTVALVPKQFWEEEGKTFPVTTEPWQLAPAPTEPTPEVTTALATRYATDALRTAALTLPSEEAGFTADPAQATLPDGTLNPLFSAWTQETFTADVAFILEKLVNPRFGDWELPQYDPQGFSAEGQKDIFTTEWWAANSGTPEAFPIYVDWSGNSYGMGDILLKGGTRWMGEVTDVQTVFTYDAGTQQYSTDLTAQVRYSAWTQDQQTVTRDATLKLKLVAAPEGSPTHTLVSAASLEVR